MSELFGTFSEIGGLASGDPYKKPKESVGRFAGKQFSTSPPKAGRAPDVYLDKTVRSNALGDRYVDAWILDKRLSRIPGKPVSNKPFYRSVGTVNSSISCGPGSTDGCLSKQIPFDTDGSAAAIKSSPPKRAADKLKNMYTTFPKAGGCGQPWKDRTLGEVPKYHPDTYEGYREKEKELRKATAKLKASKPFVSSAKPSTAFTPDADLYYAHLAGTSRPSTSAGTRAASAPRERPQSAPWRPSSPPKAGAPFCVLSHVGRDYVPDPVKEAKFHVKEGSVKPFRPASGSKARLSMWTPNPYATESRPAPSIDFTLIS